MYIRTTVHDTYGEARAELVSKLGEFLLANRKGLFLRTPPRIEQERNHERGCDEYIGVARFIEVRHPVYDTDIYGISSYGLDRQVGAC